MKSWVEVSERRLTANYKLLAEAAGPDTSVLAVVKADAYGHGAAVCAPVLAHAGAEWLGVTDAAEGIAVRTSLGASQPHILVMSGLLPEEANAVVEHSLTPVVWTIEQLEWLTEAVARHSNHAALPVHLEVDTGMARQGAAVGEELNAILSWLSNQSALQLDGVMTHFASAEVAGSQQTLDQRTKFEAAMSAVAAAGLKPVWVHAGNSSTVDNRGDGEADSLAWLLQIATKAGARAMVRPGLGLYGYALPIEQENGPEALPKVREGLQPVMCWKTRVIGIRDVQPGDTVGYNATFVAERPMRLALLPVGYADGLRRELSSAAAGGWVIVQGQKAAIVGRVSMNLTVVDATGLTNIAVGEEVVLLGDGVTAEDHARLAGTIAYEIVCGVRSQPRLVP